MAPLFLASGSAATVTAANKLPGPSAEMAVEGRIAPTTTTGAPQLTVISIAKAVSSYKPNAGQLTRSSVLPKVHSPACRFRE